MKAERQKLIDKLIIENEIETQELLQEHLKQAGYDVTQATVSRDIKEMNLTKVSLKNNRSKYARHSKNDENSIFLQAVISVDYAQNIACVKCHSGTGNAACTIIDVMNLGEIVGTIAGDDTIFILLKTTEKAQEFVEKLKEILNKF